VQPFDSGAGASLAPSDSRPRPLPGIVVASLALGYCLLAVEPWPVGVFQDDGIYAVLAKSLATGHGYRYLNLPGEPHATHYPPLYPALLAALWKLWPDFPRNVVLFKLVNAVLTAVAGYFAFTFGRDRLRFGTLGAAAVSASFTACAPIVLLTVMVLSEPLFLAALFPVLFIAERAATSERDRDAIAAGIAGALLALIRTLGIVVVPATVLVLVSRRRWRAAALVCAAALVVTLPWLLWVAAHAQEVPPVLVGKYGSYLAWLGDAVHAGGAAWMAKLVAFNLAQIVAQGWATVAADGLWEPVRWASTGALTALFATGWWRLVRRAPVTAWMVAAYLALAVSWPFLPARFTWGIWPLVGFIYALAVQALVAWRPARPLATLRRLALATALLLMAGYVRYNWLGTSRGWWTQVQQMTADRARPFVEWVSANAAPDAIVSTDDELLIHLYTGRRAVPNATFTADEHMKLQTRAFAAASLRTILRTYNADYVMASARYGTYAVRELTQATPPELRVVRVLSSGAILAPVRADPCQ